MNYKIIVDYEEYEKFLSWLPDLNLKEGETYYVSLLARRKYCTDESQLPISTVQVKRFTANSKQFLTDKLRQLECPMGYYQSHGKPIPQESLAVYIHPNPRSQKLAAKNLLVKLAQLVTDEYNGYNVHQESLSELQKSCSRKEYIDFDFDGISLEELQSRLSSFAFLTKDNSIVVSTRGGAHLLIAPSKIESCYSRSWYKELDDIEFCDVKGDNMIPIPGCTQGNFVPKLICCQS